MTIMATGLPASAGTRVLRLRPSVHASPVPDGIHLRGWSAACTIEGSADLWRLWQRLEPVLAKGMAPERLDAISALPGVRRAVRRLVDALREHGMLVEAPRASGPPDAVADWLEAVAPDPGDAWSRLRAATVGIHGAGPVADAAIRALAATGLRPAPGEVGDARVVRLVAGAVSVAAGAGEQKGFVSAPTVGARAAGDAVRIADRLGLAATGRVPDPLAALVAGAAAHRVACRVAGLPDPASEATSLAAARIDADAIGAEWPAVLVARAEPLTAAYRPWLLGGAGAAGTEDTLDDALRRLDALCDEELGVLPAPELDDLPQLPAALATCRTPAGLVVGTGATTGAAGLDAALRAAATGLGHRFAVGADRRHADGILLRRAALAASPAGAHAEDPWRSDPMARRWWTALTVRFGVPARGAVDRVTDGVFVARIQSGGRQLGWAVEATPGDAAAFAALAATAAVQARDAGLPTDAAPPTLCGGGPRPTPPYGGAGSWMTGPWTWPGTRPAEERLQQTLRRIVPPARHPRPTRPPSGPLAEALAAAGFAVSAVPA